MTRAVVRAPSKLPRLTIVRFRIVVQPARKKKITRSEKKSWISRCGAEVASRLTTELGCSKRYLHMLFSERGTTVSDYIWQARLQNCRQELEAHAGKTITDVAFSWGFSSSSHFSRVFRKYFGVVPSSIHKAQQATASSGEH